MMTTDSVDAEVVANAEARRRRRLRRRVVVLSVLLIGWASAAVVLRRPWFQGNWGIVEPGRVYRSAQPNRDFPRLIAAHQLASVLNLRGGSVGDSWYVAEVQAIERGGLDFYDFPMNATRRPTRRELLTLIDLFQRCRYPLLIHCKSGSDRTGLATAIYRMMMRNEGPTSALDAFSLSYGHIPLFGTRHLHEPFYEYQAWLDTQRLTHDPERFRAWVEHEYRSDDAPGVLRPLPVGPRQPFHTANRGTGGRSTPAPAVR
ncbi:MAG: tyrosine-protein phosphatase [Isosphaeraceae bacterium]